MKTEEHPKSLARLIANLSNDPDIQSASEIKAARESLEAEDASIARLKQRVLQATRAPVAKLETKRQAQAAPLAEAPHHSLDLEPRPFSRSEQEPASRRHARTPTPRATGLVQPFPRWSGRVNLPKGFEDAITSTADIPAREEEQLALDADTLPTEFWTKVWHVVDHNACLLISAQADPSKLEISVTGARDEPSDLLDGAKFLSPDGSEIAEIRDKCAMLEIARLKEGFILISSTGSPLKLAAT